MRRRLAHLGCGALLLLTIGCSGNANSPRDDQPPNEDRSIESFNDDEIVEQVEQLTDCSPFVEQGSTDPSSLAESELGCAGAAGLSGTSNFLRIYDSPGAAQAALAPVSQEIVAGGNAILVAPRWIVYTFDNDAVAELLNSGYSLYRPMDPSYS